MYEGIHNIQQFADTIKGTILDMARLPKGRRIEGLRAVSDLERCGWHPAMMTDAVREVMGDTDNGWAFLEGDAEAVLANIENVIRRYLSIYGCDGADSIDDIFDMAEAAEYLGITIDGMKYHYNREKNIKGFKKHRVTLFTRAQLDAFKNRMKK